MNKKIKKIFEPNLRFYFVMLVAFCVVTFFVSQHNREIAIAEAAVIVPYSLRSGAFFVL